MLCPGRRLGVGSLLGLLLPLLGGAAVHAAERLASYPSTAALALCLFSLVEPSCLSAGVPHKQRCMLSPVLA